MTRLSPRATSRGFIVRRPEAGRRGGGKARAEHEAVFTPAVADTLVELLYALQPAARYHAKQRMFALIRAASRRRRLSAGDVRKLWRELGPELGLRRRRDVTGAAGAGSGTISGGS